ncbi:MAG: tetratricopeptide repeat protein [Alphaproteobacteria bacterium]
MRKIALAALSLLVVAAPVRAGVEEGVAAFKRGDFELAAKEFRPPAVAGNPAAQYNLAVLLSEGKGVPRDEVESVRWLRSAADQGLTVAQSSLGLTYFEGTGVARDDALAAHWSRMAADQGDGFAQAMLGVMYSAGRGVPKNHAEAYFWWTLAAAAGHKEAEEWRDAAAKWMWLQPKRLAAARNRARDWRPLASKEGATVPPGAESRTVPAARGIVSNPIVDLLLPARIAPSAVTVPPFNQTAR